MSEHSFTVYRPGGQQQDVIANTFVIENGAAIFTNDEGVRVWAFAPGTWADIVADLEE